MSKIGLEFIIFCLLIISLIILGVCISDPLEFGFLYTIERKWGGVNNVVLVYKTIINVLTVFSCTCLICLSYLVSKK